MIGHGVFGTSDILVKLNKCKYVYILMNWIHFLKYPLSIFTCILKKTNPRGLSDSLTEARRTFVEIAYIYHEERKQ